MNRHIFSLALANKHYCRKYIYNNCISMKKSIILEKVGINIFYQEIKNNQKIHLIWKLNWMS